MSGCDKCGGCAPLPSEESELIDGGDWGNEEWDEEEDLD